MGCRSTKHVPDQAPDNAAGLRRCLSLEVVDGPEDKHRAAKAAEATRPQDTVSDGADEVEEDRSLLLSLNEQDVLAMVQKAAARKFSISSDTDKELNKASSFSSKQTTVNSQAEINMVEERIGYACKKGLKPEAPNQDSFFICKVQGEFSIYGVFDGHGRKGHDVSNFIKDCLPKLLVGRPDILQDPIQVLKDAFLKTQRLVEHATNMHRIDANRSGSTASVILHDHKRRMLYTAHVGDSRCVLAKKAPRLDGQSGSAWRALDLTEDHKPNLPAEKARIEMCGGQVRFDGGFNYRVYAKGKKYPGLNMSRAMGDLLGFHDAGISAEPDVLQTFIRHFQEGASPSRLLPTENADLSSYKGSAHGGADEAADAGDPPVQKRPSMNSGQSMNSNLNPPPSFAPTLSSHSIDPMTDKFLLICSDGVWEFMSSEEATLTVSEFASSDAMVAAEHLACASWDRWMHYMAGEVVDDITVLLVHLDAA